MSTGFTGWWCRSAARFALTGYGAARRRALPPPERAARASGSDALGMAIRRAEDKTRQMKARTSAIEWPGSETAQMKARARAIDELMASGPDDAS